MEVKFGGKVAMRPDRQKVYERPQDFFDLDGSAWMKLNRRAAVALCSCAAARGLVLVRVEAGISRNGSFEARLDGIWDGADPPIEPKAAHGNNLDAAAFIQSCGYNA